MSVSSEVFLVYMLDEWDEASSSWNNIVISDDDNLNLFHSNLKPSQRYRIFFNFFLFDAVFCPTMNVQLAISHTTQVSQLASK